MSTNRPPVINYEGSDYQTSFWEQGDRAYEDAVEAIALRRLLPPSGRMLLEVGAGAGRNTPRYTNFRQIALLDYSLSQLQQAQARLGREERYVYVAADVYRLPFAPAQFDAATMIRTLHHMAEPQLALQQIRTALRVGAILVLEFANKHNLKAILRYLLRRQRWSPYSLDPVEFTALNFDFHPKAVRNWLKQANFYIDRQLTVSHFRMGLLKRLFPLRVLVGLDALAQHTGNLWQLSPSVFVRASATGGSFTISARGMFRCIQCNHHPLDLCPDSVACPACGHQWPVVDGIYDFRDVNDTNVQR